MLVFNNVLKKYGAKTVIDRLNVTFPNTGYLLLSGDNGSGKTTILNIISKRIKFSGKVESNIKQSDLYYVFNKEPLYSYLTLSEKAKIIVGYNYDKFIYYLNKFNLSNLLNHKINSLSSGESQKINLIFALVSNKKVLLLDEPFEYIDKESKPLFIDELICKSKECLIIETCHENVHACDFIYFLIDGKLKVEEENNTINEIRLVNNEKRNYLQILSILFKRKPKSIKMLISFLTLLLFFVLSISTKCLSISIKDINNSIINNSSNNLVYDYDTAKSYKYITVDTNYIENYFPSIENKSSTLSPKRIVIRDKVIINGENIKLLDNEVYISDYMYNLLTYGGLYDFSYPIVYESTFNIPKKNLYDYNLSDIKIEYINQPNINFNIKIYETNYRDYLPTNKDVTSAEFRNEVSEFYEMANNYYFDFYVNEDTSVYFMNSFNNNSEENKQSYFYSFNYNGIVICTTLSNMYGQQLKLKDDEFSCDLLYANDVLGYNFNDSVKLEDKIYNIVVNDVTLKLKPGNCFKSAPIKYPRLYLSYNNFKMLYNHLGADKYENYDVMNNINYYDKDDLNDEFFANNNTMYKDAFIKLKNNNKLVRIPSIIVTSISCIVLILINILYYLLYYRKEKEIEDMIKVKGFNSIGIFYINILPNVMLFLITLSISLLLSFILFEYIASTLGLLFI